PGPSKRAVVLPERVRLLRAAGRLLATGTYLPLDLVTDGVVQTLDPAERIARRRAGRPHGVALLATGEADKRVRGAQDLLRSPVGAGQRFRHVLARPRRGQPLLERADPVFRPELAEKATRPRALDDLVRRDRRHADVPRTFEQRVPHDLHRLAQRPRARAPHVDAL